ncbi:MAG: PAS domain S-box protein [Bryobacterales bacterium]|nr:PAS domain S-box protein [Bryobacterales bacterium]
MDARRMDLTAMNQIPTESGLLSRILDLAEDAVITIGRDQRVLYFNAGAEHTFGYKREEVLGLSINILIPASFRRAHTAQVKEFAASPEASKRMGDRAEIVGLRRDGTEFPAEASISKAEQGGELLYMVILRDITARKDAERKIEQSLREKEALLQEIHHRVKNNLQVVSSLLGLQSRQVADEEIRRAFRESQNRVHSMALIHERLYQSEDLSKIDCQEYADQLVGHLFRSYGVSLSRVKLEMDFGGERMPMALAVPIGLILNELLSNCLKHAFPLGRNGEISVRLDRQQDGKLCLRVSDNGVGLPKNVNLWNARSLGLRLVRILSEQMGAELNIRSEGGTCMELVFQGQSATGAHPPAAGEGENRNT